MPARPIAVPSAGAQVGPAPRAWRIGAQGLQGTCHGLRLVVFQQDATTAVVKLLTDPGQVAGDHREPRPHGFEHGQREGLMVRYQHEHLRRCQQARDVMDIARQFDLHVRHGLRPCLDGRALRAFAGDHEFALGQPGLPEGIKQDVGSLGAGKARNHRDASQRSTWAGPLRHILQPVADHADARVGKRQCTSQLALAFGHADQPAGQRSEQPFRHAGRHALAPRRGRLEGEAVYGIDHWYVQQPAATRPSAPALRCGRGGGLGPPGCSAARSSRSACKARKGERALSSDLS